MRIFQALVVALVVLAVFIIWRAGQMPRGELQTLQAPGAETPQPDNTPDLPTPLAPEAPVAEPTDPAYPAVYSVNLSPDQVDTLSGEWITVTAQISGGLLELRLPPLNGESASPAQQQRIFLPTVAQ